MALPPQRKRGQTIHSEARNIIGRVIEECDREKAAKSLTFPLNKATDRIAAYCGVSDKTVLNIRKEMRESEDGQLSTPGKKRSRCAPSSVDIDSFDRMVIRNTILHFYDREKTVPTVSKLIPVLRDKIAFSFCPSTLRKVLGEMGFKWKKTTQKRKLLIERPDIVYWRHKYLRSLKSLRDEGRTIYYLDETWVDSNLTFRKCWQAQGVRGILSNSSSSSRLIVVSIGSIEGFVPGATLVFKSGTTSGDYHGQMNGKNFEKWVTEKVIPNLKPASVVVMDNAPYHGVQVDKPPTKYATKVSMMSWLQKNGIHFDSTLRKADLFDIVAAHTPAEKVFVIDEMLKANGHQVIRLPPYMCELSPIELAWAQMKRYIRDRNTAGDLSMKRLQELTHEAIASVTHSYWKSFNDHVIKLEQEFWTNDGVQEQAIDRMVISLGADLDCSSSEEDASSDDEVELATPL